MADKSSRALSKRAVHRCPQASNDGRVHTDNNVQYMLESVTVFTFQSQFVQPTLVNSNALMVKKKKLKQANTSKDEKQKTGFRDRIKRMSSQSST